MALNPPSPGGAGNDPYNPPGTSSYVTRLADDGSPGGAIIPDAVTGNPVVAGLRGMANAEVDVTAEMVTPSPAAPQGSTKQDFGEVAPFNQFKPPAAPADAGAGLADQPLNKDPDYVYLH